MLTNFLKSGHLHKLDSWNGSRVSELERFHCTCIMYEQLNFEYYKIFKNKLLYTWNWNYIHVALRTYIHTFMINNHVYTHNYKNSHLAWRTFFLCKIEQICQYIYTHKAKSTLALNKNGFTEILQCRQHHRMHLRDANTNRHIVAGWDC